MGEGRPVRHRPPRGQGRPTRAEGRGGAPGLGRRVLLPAARPRPAAVGDGDPGPRRRPLGDDLEGTPLHGRRGGVRGRGQRAARLALGRGPAVQRSLVVDASASSAAVRANRLAPTARRHAAGGFGPQHGWRRAPGWWQRSSACCQRDRRAPAPSPSSRRGALARPRVGRGLGQGRAGRRAALEPQRPDRDAPRPRGHERAPQRAEGDQAKSRRQRERRGAGGDRRGAA